MSRSYSDIAFTPAVRAMQTRMGSRSTYAPLDHTDDRGDALTADEAEFIPSATASIRPPWASPAGPMCSFAAGRRAS